MEREQVLAFRAARQGLASLEPRSLAEAAACPASEFQRGSALLALAARTSAIDRERYDAALDAGELEGELGEVDGGWVLAEDEVELESPPDVKGLRLLPPGDPFLQRPNRALLVPDAALHKRVFRPVGSPGVVLQDGELGGLWRPRARGAKLELEVEPVGRIDRGALEAEAERMTGLRGAREVRLSVS